MKTEYNFELFADYFQFYLKDEGVQIDPSRVWNREKSEQMLGACTGLIAVGTARNMNVPVRIIIRNEKPSLEPELWDRINECNLSIKSGKIVVMGCTDYYPDAARILVEPGVYRVRIHYGGLGTLSENELDGNDHYELILWPEPEERETERIK